eukprot:gene8165-11050_t
MIHNDSENTKTIKVLIRLKPSTVSDTSNEAVEMVNQNTLHTIKIEGDFRNAPKAYVFDKIFPKDSSQEDLYNSIREVVSTTLNGNNATVLVHGAASSGKTYTMMGTEDNPGITPRIINDLFATLEVTKENDPNKSYFIEMSYVEFYGNQFRNLLGKFIDEDGNRIQSNYESDIQNSKIAYSNGSKSLMRTSSKLSMTMMPKVAENVVNSNNEGIEGKSLLRPSSFSSINGSKSLMRTSRIEGKSLSRPSSFSSMVSKQNIDSSSTPDTSTKTLKKTMSNASMVGFNRQQSLSSRDKIDIHESKEVGVFLSGNGIRLQILNQRDAMEMIYAGHKNRIVRVNDLNELSSRGHAILTIYIEIRNVIPIAGSTNQAASDLTMGRLHLVDLAGYSVNRSSSAEALIESQHIHQSLASLGDVLSTLARKATLESKPKTSGYDYENGVLVPLNLENKAAHIPYLNSKLTHILKDSLGSSCYTIFVATIATDTDSHQQTSASLLYASWARNISCKDFSNSLENDADQSTENDPEVSKLKKVIDERTKQILQQYLEQKQQSSIIESSSSSSSSVPAIDTSYIISSGNNLDNYYVYDANSQSNRNDVNNSKRYQSPTHFRVRQSSTPLQNNNVQNRSASPALSNGKQLQSVPPVNFKSPARMVPVSRPPIAPTTTPSNDNVDKNIEKQDQESKSSVVLSAVRMEPSKDYDQLLKQFLELQAMNDYLQNRVHFFESQTLVDSELYKYDQHAIKMNKEISELLKTLQDQQDVNERALLDQKSSTILTPSTNLQPHDDNHLLLSHQRPLSVKDTIKKFESVLSPDGGSIKSPIINRPTIETKDKKLKSKSGDSHASKSSNSKSKSDDNKSKAHLKHKHSSQNKKSSEKSSLIPGPTASNRDIANATGVNRPAANNELMQMVNSDDDCDDLNSEDLSLQEMSIDGQLQLIHPVKGKGDSPATIESGLTIPSIASGVTSDSIKVNDLKLRSEQLKKRAKDLSNDSDDNLSQVSSNSKVDDLTDLKKRAMDFTKRSKELLKSTKTNDDEEIDSNVATDNMMSNVDEENDVRDGNLLRTPTGVFVNSEIIQTDSLKLNTAQIDSENVSPPSLTPDKKTSTKQSTSKVLTYKEYKASLKLNQTQPAPDSSAKDSKKKKSVKLSDVSSPPQLPTIPEYALENDKSNLVEEVYNKTDGNVSQNSSKQVGLFGFFQQLVGLSPNSTSGNNNNANKASESDSSLNPTSTEDPMDDFMVNKNSLDDNEDKSDKPERPRSTSQRVKSLLRLSSHSDVLSGNRTSPTRSSLPRLASHSDVYNNNSNGEKSYLRSTASFHLKTKDGIPYESPNNSQKKLLSVLEAVSLSKHNQQNQNNENNNSLSPLLTYSSSDQNSPQSSPFGLDFNIPGIQNIDSDYQSEVSALDHKSIQQTIQNGSRRSLSPKNSFSFGKQSSPSIQEQLEEKIKQTKFELKVEKSRLKDMHHQLETIRKESNEHETHIHQLEDDFAKANNRIFNQNQKYEMLRLKSQEKSQELNEKIAQLSKNIIAKDGDMLNLSKELDHVTRELSDSSRELEETKNIIKHLRIALTNARSETQYDRLQQEKLILSMTTLNMRISELLAVLLADPNSALDDIRLALETYGTASDSFHSIKNATDSNESLLNNSRSEVSLQKTIIHNNAKNNQNLGSLSMITADDLLISRDGLDNNDKIVSKSIDELDVTSNLWGNNGKGYYNAGLEKLKQEELANTIKYFQDDRNELMKVIAKLKETSQKTNKDLDYLRMKVKKIENDDIQTQSIEIKKSSNSNNDEKRVAVLEKNLEKTNESLTKSTSELVALMQTNQQLQ